MNTNTDPSAQKIIFDDLAAGDTLLLATQNSKYQFILIDTKAKRGLLTGGAFGKKTVKADICQPFEVQAGGQVQFHVELPHHHIYLKTTAIIGLKVIRRREIQMHKLQTLASYPSQTAGLTH